jgi:hypothetical protein
MGPTDPAGTNRPDRESTRRVLAGDTARESASRFDSRVGCLGGQLTTVAGSRAPAAHRLIARLAAESPTPSVNSPPTLDTHPTETHASTRRTRIDRDNRHVAGVAPGRSAARPADGVIGEEYLWQAGANAWVVVDDRNVRADRVGGGHDHAGPARPGHNLAHLAAHGIGHEPVETYGHGVRHVVVLNPDGNSLSPAQ